MQLFHQDIMDCPNCGKRGLVKQNNDIYQCLCCGFRRNLSEPILGNELLGLVLALVLSTLVLSNPHEATPNNSQPQLESSNSSSIPMDI